VSAWQTVRLIAGREVRQRLRSRMFVGTTLVLSVLLVLGALVPALLGAFDRSPDDDPVVAEPVRVAVVGSLAAAETEALEAALGPLTTVPAADEAAVVTALEEESADLGIIAGERVLAPPATGMFAVGTGRALQAAEALALTEMLDTVGASGSAAAVLGVEPLPVEVIGEADQLLQAARLIAANLAVVFIFAMLMFYASMIVNGIIEEKGSRVVELLVEAVPIRQLLAGKVLGLGTIALGQMLVLFVPATAVLVVANRDLIPAGIGGMLAIMGLWFVLGYVLYTLISAGLGALVSRPEEAQAVLTPASLLALVGYLVGLRRHPGAGRHLRGRGRLDALQRPVRDARSPARRGADPAGGRRRARARRAHHRRRRPARGADLRRRHPAGRRACRCPGRLAGVDDLRARGAGRAPSMAAPDQTRKHPSRTGSSAMMVATSSLRSRSESTVWKSALSSGARATASSHVERSNGSARTVSQKPVRRRTAAIRSVPCCWRRLTT
jgi:ABC-2 type transport system permease protein